MANKGGLNKDGGISFERKRNFGTKKKSNLPEGMFSRKPEDKIDEVEEKPEEPKEERNIDVKELAKMERLNAKLSNAKRIQAGGLAFNSTTIIGVLFYLDSLLIDPNTLVTLNNINDMFGMDIDFENMIAIIQGYKAQIIGMCISTQTMVMGYKDTVQKMKDRGNESFYEVMNEELEKIGI